MISEDHPIYKAIDSGGGQACDIRGVIRELNAAGYAIVPATPTDAMCNAPVDAGNAARAKAIWLAMIDEAIRQ